MLDVRVQMLLLLSDRRESNAGRYCFKFQDLNILLNF